MDVMQDRFITAIKEGKTVAVIGKDSGFYLKKVLHNLGIEADVSYLTSKADVEQAYNIDKYVALVDKAERYGTHFDVCARLVDGEIASMTCNV